MKEFEPEKYLYHYTKFENCLKIISSNELLYSQLSNMNDINELYRPIYSNDIADDLEQEAEEYLGKFQQISLTICGPRMGFDIPSMWGHYADNGNGVCLVLDKKLLINSLKGDIDIFHYAIDYSGEFSPDIIFELIDERKIKPFNEAAIMDYFFKKTGDWSYEQEYRIIHSNADQSTRKKLSLGESLVAVIMHNAPDVPNSQTIFDSDNYKNLSKIFTPKNIWEYSMFLGERNLRDKERNCIWSSKELIDWDRAELGV